MFYSISILFFIICHLIQKAGAASIMIIKKFKYSLSVSFDVSGNVQSLNKDLRDLSLIEEGEYKIESYKEGSYKKDLTLWILYLSFLFIHSFLISTDFYLIADRSFIRSLLYRVWVSSLLRIIWIVYSLLSLNKKKLRTYLIIWSSSVLIESYINSS